MNTGVGRRRWGLLMPTSSSGPTPVALFTYNRPEHAARAIRALARCDRFAECRLHVYCDGASNVEHAEMVTASRRVVREWATRLDAEVIERENNLGLAKSIVGGVAELCEKYGRVIVVEDDLMVSPDFLDYMIQALARYEASANVYQIAGHMFHGTQGADLDASFIPLPTTWGWATWKRAWQIFDWQAKGAQETLSDPANRWRFDLEGAYPYASMLEQRLAGANQSWGILWVWAIFKANGLVLHPRRSLVWVGGSGADGQGTHCGDVSEFPQDSQQSFMERRLSQPLRFPESIVTDEVAFRGLKDFLRKYRHSAGDSLRDRLGFRLRRYVQRFTN